MSCEGLFDLLTVNSSDDQIQIRLSSRLVATSLNEDWQNGPDEPDDQLDERHAGREDQAHACQEDGARCAGGDRRGKVKKIRWTKEEKRTILVGYNTIGCTSKQPWASIHAAHPEVFKKN